MKRHTPKTHDALTMMAVAKARKKEERKAVSYLVAMAIVAIGLALIAWWFWPEEVPRVTLAAYDTVATPEQSITLHARAEPENKERSAKVDGLDVRFQIAATQKDETAATDAQGVASIPWSAPKKEVKAIEFLVRHQHKDDPKQVARDSGRVYIWPANTKLLVVDADHALADGVEALRDGTGGATAKPGAAKALKSLAARYMIVYLTALMDRPTTYRRLRSFLTQPATTVDGQLPDGPLLGPTMPLGDGDADVFTMGQIEALKKAFPGEMIGVAGRGVEAKMFLDAGWKAFVIGDSVNAPAGSVAVRTWKEWQEKLAP